MDRLTAVLLALGVIALLLIVKLGRSIPEDQ